MPTYSFHSFIASAYSAVHKWLEIQPQANGYKDITSYSQCNENLPLQSAAAQYRIYFPAHYFKIIHILETIITPTKLLDWFTYNPYICIIDIGCNAGAASIAFIETILRLEEQKKLVNKVGIYCIGIDVNKHSLAIYNQLMKEVSFRISSSNIKLEYQVIPRSIREASLPVIASLAQKRSQWLQPFLSHVFLLQSNIVDILKKKHYLEQQEYNQLKELDIDSNIILEDYNQFSKEYALAYKQFLEEIPIDNIHIITTDTGNNNDEYLRVKEMANAFDEVFLSKNHTIERLGEGTYKVEYENPVDSYWRTTGNKQYYSNFHVDVSSITSTQLSNDQDWLDVISIENLQLAWARARHNFFAETLFDEVEIRLFEKNLNENLNRLQQQLIAYAEDVALDDDRILYKFPKPKFNSRPKALSRMEEEILSVAIIQKLGHKADSLQSSNAHRLARRKGNQDTEYLYEPWFNSYFKRFLFEAKKSAEKYDNSVVIKVDIQSYYTKIIQENLIDLTAKELRTQSERVRWLLRILLSKELDEDEHEIGRGITQGGVGSGFYSNIYLTPIDAKFKANNEWDVEYHRYADDILLIIPNQEDVKNVMDFLPKELEKIGLELNDDKTKIYNATEFLEEMQEDEILEELNKNFNDLTNLLWIMNAQYRKKFRNYFESDEQWWFFIEQYRHCLESISIYISSQELSRKLYKYLFKQEDDLEIKAQLDFPQLMDNDSWNMNFNALNIEWIQSKDKLYKQLIKIFKESLEELITNSEQLIKQQGEKRIRSVINKLTYLGFTDISQQVSEILCNMPWIFRKSSQNIIESLARQGYQTEIINVLESYENSTNRTADYMRAITLRGMRFLPKINSREWDKVVEFSTINNSVVTKLMATETWLYLINFSNSLIKKLVKPSDIDALIKALNTNPPPINRLKKNYLLILGQYKPEYISNEIFVDNNGDYMLTEVGNILSKDGSKVLFKHQEPKIIRDKYYSGTRQTGSETLDSGY